MNALLIASLFVTAAPDVTSSDWVSVGKDEFLAFRPMTTQSSGAVWYIRSGSNRGSVHLDAYSGEYVHLGGNRVRVAFTRCWNSCYDSQRKLWWANDSSYRNHPDWDGDLYSVVLEIESSGSGIVATVLNPEWINDYGQRQSGDASFESAHLKAGTVLDLEPVQKHPFNVATDPPGFVRRSSWRSVAAREPTTVYETQHLRQDLYGWSYNNDTKSGFKGTMCVISLQSGTKWSEGTAWLISQNSGTKTGFLAHRGLYTIYSNKLQDQDTLILSFTTTRLYRGTSAGSRITWKMETDLEPVQVQFDLPLSDHSLSDQIVLAVRGMDYADSSGNVISKYSRDGFFSLPSRYWPYSIGNLREETTLSLTSGRPKVLSNQQRALLDQLETTPPPGFRFRSAADEHVVAKVPSRPSVDSTPTKKSPATLAWERAQKADENKEYKAAASAYEETIRLAPSFAGGFNGLAWLKATCPDASMRDGIKAIELAKRACELTEYKKAYILDTLAAAYAETGDFGSAVKWQQQAVELIDEDQKSSYLEHLVKFLQKEPIREP